MRNFGKLCTLLAFLCLKKQTININPVDLLIYCHEWPRIVTLYNRNVQTKQSRTSYLLTTSFFPTVTCEHWPHVVHVRTGSLNSSKNTAVPGRSLSRIDSGFNLYPNPKSFTLNLACGHPAWWTDLCMPLGYHLSAAAAARSRYIFTKNMQVMEQCFFSQIFFCFSSVRLPPKWGKAKLGIVFGRFYQY